MSYQQIVSDLTTNELAVRARTFIDRFDTDKSSVVLVPGGMGSRLMQSTEPYVDGQPYPAAPVFIPLWLSLPAIVRGEVGNLGVLNTGRDQEGMPIVASGELRTIIKAYDETEKYFLHEGRANYIEFGYDWRRDPARAAEYLKVFLEAIQTGVQRDHGVDPLPQLTLFAHSMGGLVTKLFINNLVDAGQDTRRWFEYFISAATPFYGTLTHVHRYYVGVKGANFVLGAGNVRNMVATMPGPYGLLPAPRSVMEPRLAALGLDAYPVVDADDPAQAVDMFDPANRRRFPPGMNPQYFLAARRMFMAIDRDLPADVSERIYHMRADATRAPDNPDDNRLMIHWRNVNGAVHVADDGSPVTPNGGFGDGTVPFWSARLPSTPDANVLSFEGVEHGSMAETGKTIKTVFKIMNGERPPFQPESPDAPLPKATEAAVAKLINDIQLYLTDADDAERAITPEIGRTLGEMTAFA